MHFQRIPECIQFAPGYAKMVLRPNPAFVPKNPNQVCLPLELAAFHHPPFSSSEQQHLHTLCPVCALHIYMGKTKGFRKAEQLFVS